MRVEFAIALFLTLITATCILATSIFANFREQEKMIQKLSDELHIIQLDHVYMRQEFEIMRDIAVDVQVEFKYPSPMEIEGVS